MDWLWKCSFCTFSVYVVTIVWWFELYCRDWPKIFEKSYEVQKEFGMIGIKLNFLYLPRITLIISIFHVIFSIAHCCIVKYFDKGFLNLMEVSSSAGAWAGLQKWLGYGLMAFTVVLDFFAWNAWHFADTFRAILAIYIWRLLRALNNGVKDFGSEKLEEVMRLHTKIVDLLRSINQTISGMTFVGSIYMVIYSCLLINYFLRGYGTIGRAILTVHFLLKNLIIYGVSADVSAKAHAISDWIQNCTTQKEFKLNCRSTNKLIIFASQIYSKDSIGFKGLQFFTITASFLTAIFSLIATYTIVITQLLDQNETRKDK
ncbi:unnamed protein product [Allacma fusca]|uniref:Gustatory receptor n=1 Tax=Allacma fusca TaxID=39272 RepID=A0A8J2K5K3_9HEXA|nr:unnamed protein product [Allacma fusca]